METLATAAGALSLPFFSPNKSKDAPFSRIVRFSTSPKSSDDGSNNCENNLKFDPLLKMQLTWPLGNLQDAAMGLVLSAASVRGWTTGSGMEGPSVPVGQDSESGTPQVSTFPWSLFTKSPRRRMRVAFTCKVCGQRTTRAINPHAYTDGTVFVQCCGCNIFHKLVDNLNLFHEMKCYVNSSFNPNPNDNMNFKYLDLDENNNGDIFPHL
ncbi:Zim17-type zinc finger protein [Striga asiatica]|uniref:Zim17-type zinc finger protein n=1 Tax=Striga asiatica TaxID=4170 RepID=A0A5A7Q454_STRAF|nr:Zim17-type zinc finger protein [Striga asiatica]